jgi:hypothetical protein
MLTEVLLNEEKTLVLAEVVCGASSVSMLLFLLSEFLFASWMVQKGSH